MFCTDHLQALCPKGVVSLKKPSCSFHAVSILCVAHRALCMFGQLEAAADALHHLLVLVSSGEAAAATTLAHDPADQSSQPQGPALLRPHSQSFSPPTTAEQSEGMSASYVTAGALVPTAQTRSGGQAELSQQQSSVEASVIVDSSHTGSQPVAKQHIGADPKTHPLQSQSPTSVPSQPQGQLPSAPLTSDQQVTHQLMHSQQAFGQPDRLELRRQGSSQPRDSPEQLEQAAASQGSLQQQPQHGRETSRHAELPYYQLKLIREACHTVMTLAEKRGQPTLMLPLLESMQQVGSSPILRVLTLNLKTFSKWGACKR